MAAVIQGTNRYWRWERLDDGSDPDRANQIARSQEVVLAAVEHTAA